MLIVVGTSHKYSPIALREKFYFSRKELRQVLIRLPENPVIKGVIALSTCNRIEFYADVIDKDLGFKLLEEIFLSSCCVTPAVLDKYFYKYSGTEAVRHLFKVSCGLDSQILGETQILEQLISAHTRARAMELTSSFLDDIFNKAVEAHLSLRQETGINIGNVSVASITLDLLKKQCGAIEDKKIMIIGGGRTSELLTESLAKEKARAIFIANRTYEKAAQLAKALNTEAVRFDSLPKKIPEVDIIIAATSSPHLIIKKEDLLKAKRPLLIVDLAVPRDVDPEIKFIDGVSLFNLDDLNPVIEDSLGKRKEFLSAARESIERQVHSLCLEERLRPEHVEVRLR
jgi:glutamyl-tRNA reductase